MRAGSERGKDRQYRVKEGRPAKDLERLRQDTVKLCANEVEAKLELGALGLHLTRSLVPQSDYLNPPRSCWGSERTLPGCVSLGGG